MKPPLAWVGSVSAEATSPNSPQTLFIAGEVWRAANLPEQSLGSTSFYRPIPKTVRHGTAFAMADVELKMGPEPSQRSGSARATERRQLPSPSLARGNPQGWQASCSNLAVGRSQRQPTHPAAKKTKGATLSTYLMGVDSGRLLEHAEVRKCASEYRRQRLLAPRRGAHKSPRCCRRSIALTTSLICCFSGDPALPSRAARVSA